jgi:hypothetical protein
MKDYWKLVNFGIKTLLNSDSQEFFQNSWTIIKTLWIENNIPSKFITTFRKEYIDND